MTKIFYLDVELDNSKEHEIVTKSEFGFTVTVIYKNNKTETFNNVTKVSL